MDRCLGNAEWCAAFPTMVVHHLPMMRSDHAPILAILQTTHTYSKKPFRFENWWLLEDDFQDQAKLSWEKSRSRSFHLKTSFLASDLKKWIKCKPNLNSQLESIENRVLQQQSLPPQSKNFSLQEQLIHQHQLILDKQAEFHR